MTTSDRQLVVFSDLDGTLLDANTYDFQPARDAVALLRERRIPLILCSFKTRAEIEVYRKALALHDPFIVEDGAAIYVEPTDRNLELEFDKQVNGLQVVERGMPYVQLRARLDVAAQSHALPVKGFGQVTADEIASVSGLTLDAARKARRREYSETLVSEYSEGQLARLRTALGACGLRLRFGGRFFGVTAQHDKSTAVQALLNAYRKRHQHVTGVGLGDAPNDEDFLRLMDIPILVQRPDASWADLDIPNVKRVEGVGPVGWDRAIRELLAAKPNLA